MKTEYKFLFSERLLSYTRIAFNHFDVIRIHCMMNERKGNALTVGASFHDREDVQR